LQEPLTPREEQVLRLAAVGLTHKEIACRLGIRAKTARNHLCNLYDKLGIHGRAEAVLHAIRLGLIDPNERTGYSPPTPALRRAPGAPA
jgi:NarL family two-component system response regulator LiaR